MARFRREFILKEAAQSSDSTTLRTELPEAGHLSALLLRIAATNGATSNKDAEIWRTITRVEVRVNGSDVIFSLTGQEFMRYAWHLKRRFPDSFITEAADAVQFVELPIYFGRFIGDPRFSLNLANFTSVDVTIEYNLAAVRATGGTGFVASTFTVTMAAYRAPSAAGISSQGFRQVREIRTFTSAASGDDTTNIDSRHKLIGIGVMAFEEGIADNVDILTLKLQADAGQTILFDAEWDHLQSENMNVFNYDIQTRGAILGSDADTVETWTGLTRQFTIEQTKNAVEAA